MIWDLKSIKNAQFTSLLILGISLFFVSHLLLLSPSSLEEGFSDLRILRPEELLSFFRTENKTLAHSVPMDTPPTYSLRDFTYYSSPEQSEPWRLDAKKANFYQEAELIHSRSPRITLQDGTLIESLEGLMKLKESKIEFFGEVYVTLPDQTTIKTDYAELLTKPQTRISVPLSHLVQGQSKTQTTKSGKLNWSSYGLDYFEQSLSSLKKVKVVRLLSQVKVHFTSASGDSSLIQSDTATLFQSENRALFEMFPSRPLPERFVKAQDDSLNLFAREMEAFLEDQELKTIFARRDVRFDDSQNPLEPVSGTAGLAQYDPRREELTLERYPQVYQNDETITGEVMVYYRQNDTIEVKGSNALYRR